MIFIIFNIFSLVFLNVLSTDVIFRTLPPFDTNSSVETRENTLVSPNDSSETVAYVAVDTIYTDHSQGIFQKTDSPLDLALEGDGFFEVDTPQGIRYTRNGNFRLDTEQHVVTQDGNFVLNSNQKKIKIQ